MKIIHYLLFLFAMSSFVLTAQQINMLTYNIKYDNVNDTINNWHDRKEAMVDLIEHYEVSFIGGQEVLHRQLVYLDDSLTKFSYIGVGRDDGRQKGEYSPIFYDSTRYKVLQSNTFWLSKTPEKISVGWDAAMERICTYGLFQEIATGEKLYVFNTHFDHMGKEARTESAKLIINQIKKINTKQLPVVLMGDFNLTPYEKPIKYINSFLHDGKKVNKNSFYGPTGTFNGFDSNRILDHRIDYIFVKGLEVTSYVHIDDRMENNKHISDHLPVLISVER